MRKALWTILAVLVVAFGAPAANADTLYTYQFTFTGLGLDLTFTTEASAAVTTQTTINAADLASYALTGSYWSGTDLASVTLDNNELPYWIIINSTGFQALYTVGLELASPVLTNLSTPGTYIYNGGSEFGIEQLVITAMPVQTPEPATLVLMLLGVWLVLVMRKRMGHIPPKAL